MADEIPPSVIYKQVLPAGIAPEVSTENYADRPTTAAFGPWLTQHMNAVPNARERVAALSGIPPGDFDQLLDGKPPFLLDTDHVQRLASALTELHLISNPADVWKAAGFEDTEYIIAPEKVLRALSQHDRLL
jgi:hypothetical protein